MITPNNRFSVPSSCDDCSDIGTSCLHFIIDFVVVVVLRVKEVDVDALALVTSAPADSLWSSPLISAFCQQLLSVLQQEISTDNVINRYEYNTLLPSGMIHPFSSSSNQQKKVECIMHIEATISFADNIFKFISFFKFVVFRSNETIFFQGSN